MLFYFAPKTVAVASHIALEEVEADYKTRELDFTSSEQHGEAYLAINPKGRVPALVTDGGILTETPAILLYLAQSHPDASLAPLEDSFRLAKVQEFNAFLCATVHVAHAHRVRGERWADDESAIKAMQQKVPQTMRACFQLIAESFFRGPWVMGQSYSIADPYLFTISNWLEGDSVDIREFPSIADHNSRMRERAAVEKILEIHGI
ncbi:MAG TPA: glutathione S-transferase [Gammaproteobacteria bacterium]|nr:glutathione S-transferase [Gammaproteobacteria bacterium]|tara:strand:- start:1113 stop:1730 length:618 start_codon:yes stop_codon:yes gene_type:complete